MRISTRKLPLRLVVAATSTAFVVGACAAVRQRAAEPSGPATTRETGCTADERREALRAEQARVLRVAPQHVASLAHATAQGGVLAGWRLSHGYVVLDSAGAVAVDNLRAREPMPPVLLYAPSAATSARDLLDFDREDGPYRLVGWAYLAPYRPGAGPPRRRCIAAREWLVHEAGWHLMDGGMLLTPEATNEPPHTKSEVARFFWHPRAWDLHVWRGDDGVPAIAFANPKASGDGMRLPDGAFFSVEEHRAE